MNSKELRKEIIMGEFGVHSGPCNFALAYPFMQGLLGLKKHYKKYYDYCFLTFKNNFAEQVQHNSDNYEVIKQLYDDVAGTLKLIEDWNKEKDEFIAKLKKYNELSNLNDGELLREYKEFLDKYVELWGAPLITDYMGDYTQKDKDLAKEEYIDMLHPDEPSFIKREQMSLAKIVEKLKAGDDVTKELEEHQQNFFWIENNYLNIKVLTKEYFLNKAKKLDHVDEEVHKEIPEEYDEKLKEKLLLTKKLTLWQDQRKETNLICGHYLNEFLKEISKRSKVSMEDLYYYAPEEIIEVFSKKTDVSKRRKQMVYLIEQNDKTQIFEGDEAKKIIKTWENKNNIAVNHWWAEEFPGNLQYAFYMLHGYMSTAKILKNHLSSCVISFSNGMIREDTRIDERSEMYKEIYENTKNDKKYLLKQWEMVKKQWSEILDNYNEFMEEKDNSSNEQLLDYYIKHFDEYVDWIGYPASIEGCDVFTDFHLYSMVKKELPELNNEELREYIHANTNAKCLSFMEEERKELLKVCLDNYEDIEKADFSKIAKKFFFMNTNYKDAYFLDEEYFKQKAKKVLEKTKEEISKELKSLESKVPNLVKKKKEFSICKVSDELRLHLDIVEEIGKQMDERKEMMTKANNMHYHFVEEIAKRFEINFEILSDYTYEEVKELLKNGSKVTNELLTKRKDYFAYVLNQEDNMKGQWFYGDQARQIIKEIDSKKGENIKGMVASAPVEKVDGTAQVILDVNKDKFEDGNILVTTMTRPEFLPIMRKASAIITDEGGLTCHAAIVSRELKIPCIIGTKIATKKLKSGDLIEMDLKEGVVHTL